jgi:glucose-1-phosphate thymidylyltransferase
LTRIVGVVPAAGHATRLQPLEGSKEVLEVGGRPVFDYLVERLRAGGVEEIRVVTRPEKQDVVDHAQHLGLNVVAARPDTAASSVAAGLHGLDREHIVPVGFPDSLWEPLDGFARLIAVLGPQDDAVLGVFRSPEPERSDVVELEDDAVKGVHVKAASPPGNLIWDIAALRRPALDELDRFAELGELLDRVARRGSVRAVVFPGEFLDIGTAEALERARRLHS